MLYKDYPGYDKQVSAIGFGGMRFDTKNQDNSQCASLVRYAYDKGINYFDTAPGYSDDRSEDIFGTAIKELGSERENFLVSTKGFPEEFDTASKAVAAVEKSLKRLNCDYIDCYHVWCIRKWEHYKLALKPGGQYEGLLRCKEKGLIKNICVSTHLPGQMIARIAESGKFAGILMGVNALNFLYRWQGVTAADDAGLAVVAMNPLAGGIIPQNYEHLKFLGPNKREVVSCALKFLISTGKITVSLVGFNNTDEVDEAVEAARDVSPVSEEQFREMKSHITQGMDVLCTACGYCVNLCPRSINIPAYMQYYNYKLMPGFNTEQMMKQLDHEFKYGILADRVSGACDCVQCGRCENACTQRLNIIERFAEICKLEQRWARQQHQQE